MRWEFKSNHIEIEGGKPRGCKKITMTKLGAILGINPWESPFSAWCDITKVYKKPFIETKETLAGKTIEPFIRKYLKEDVFFSKNILSPQEYYGNSWNDISRKYDFFPDNKIFGGMWDTVLVDKNGEIDTIFEHKTTKRVTDWANNPPQYYLAQCLGYSYMKGKKKGILTATFLEDDDYNHPENFKPSSRNTALWRCDTETDRLLLPDGCLYTIEECFKLAEEWWNKYVETGISPEFDETKKCDKEILDELRKAKAVSTNGLDNAIYLYLQKVKELNKLKKEANIEDLENEVDNIKKHIVEELKKQMKDTDNSIEYSSLMLSKSNRKSVDTEALKKDGLYDLYTKESYTYTLKIKQKEDK